MLEVRESVEIPEIHDTTAELAEFKASVEARMENSDLKIEGELKMVLEQKDFGKLEQKFFEKFGKIVISENPIIKPLVKEVIMNKLTSILLNGDHPKRKSALEQTQDIAQNGRGDWQKQATKLLDRYNNGSGYEEYSKIYPSE